MHQQFGILANPANPHWHHNKTARLDRFQVFLAFFASMEPSHAYMFPIFCLTNFLLEVLAAGCYILGPITKSLKPLQKWSPTLPLGSPAGGGERGTGSLACRAGTHMCVQLNLCKLRCVCMCIPAHHSRKLSCTCARWPDAHTSHLWTGCSPEVDHGPEIGDSCSTTHQWKPFGFQLYLAFSLHFPVV